MLIRTSCIALWLIGIALVVGYCRTPSHSTVPSLAPLNDREKRQIIGAWGPCQRCSSYANTACPLTGCTQAACQTQTVGPGGATTCRQTGAEYGCTAGNYKDCVPALKWWCGDSNVTQCGNKTWITCNSVLCGVVSLCCTGTCSFSYSSTPCVVDCI